MQNKTYKVRVKFEDTPPINILVMANCAQFHFPYALLTITYIFTLIPRLSLSTLLMISINLV